jgi:hypothetical protein
VKPDIETSSDGGKFKLFSAHTTEQLDSYCGPDAK